MKYSTDLALLIEIRDVLYEILLSSKHHGVKEAHISQAIREVTAAISEYSKTDLQQDKPTIRKGIFDFYLDETKESVQDPDK